MDISKKKIERELHMVRGAKVDFEIRIEEMRKQIEHLEQNLEIQLAKEAELEAKLKD